LATGPHRIRAVTHLMVTRAQIEQAVEAIAQEVCALNSHSKIEVSNRTGQIL
jgi:hypothetical protein